MAQGLAPFLLSLGLHLIASTAKPPAGTPLTEYIHHFEPVYYDQEAFHHNHHRAKRSTEHTLRLDFTAHKKTFHVRLRRDAQIFAKDMVVENSEGSFHYDTSRAYVGHLEGEESFTKVHGIVTKEGLFEGKITTPDDQYMVERSSKYFKYPQEYHSVIYRHSDVHMDHLNDSICRSDELHRKLRIIQAQEGQMSRLKRQAEGDYGNVLVEMEPVQERYIHVHQRRAIDPTKTTCTIYMQADHLFYRKFGRNEETVIEQLTQHVQGVNEIYRIIDFDEDAYADQINFIIKRIKVHTNPNVPGYKFPEHYGVERFLELFSEDDFDDFCLAYMFTYRDFEGGTLGLAWTGDLQNAGGVCEKKGQFRGSQKSLNSGIVTILNYGKDVPSTVSHVTMAHEIGHNMGSQHDPETSNCSPGGEQGNYIMFARATSGDKPNNNRFSKCSQISMATVMEAKARHTGGCFTQPMSSICGNEVVEEGEECDCGWDVCPSDQCCYPQVSGPTIHPPCTRKKGVCSPSEGPCCSSSCHLIGPFYNKTCRGATPCKSAAYCDGSGPGCPSSVPMPDKTRCDEDFVCYQGECTGSICQAYELESCQCAPAIPDDYGDSNLCKLCCKRPGEGMTCRSSFDWNVYPFDIPDLMAKPGMPCNDYKGYCDVFRKCREVDPSGPLANLKRLIFSDEAIQSMKEWLLTYWYVVLAAGAGFFIFMGIFIKLCSPKKKTPVTPIKKSFTSESVAHTHVVQPGWVKRGSLSGPSVTTQLVRPSVKPNKMTQNHTPPHLPPHLAKKAKMRQEGWV